MVAVQLITCMLQCWDLESRLNFCMYCTAQTVAKSCVVVYFFALFVLVEDFRVGK